MAEQAHTYYYIRPLRAAVIKHLSEKMGLQTGEILAPALMVFV